MYLTKCLKCNTIMYEDNPSEVSRDYTDKEIEDINILNITIVYDDNDDEKEYGFLACPKCLHDGNLIDCVDDIKEYK